MSEDCSLTISCLRLVIMTHDELWLAKYNEVRSFIEINHRNPSKYRIEEHGMLNWLKANRKPPALKSRERGRREGMLVSGMTNRHFLCKW